MINLFFSPHSPPPAVFSLIGWTITIMMLPTRMALVQVGISGVCVLLGGEGMVALIKQMSRWWSFWLSWSCLWSSSEVWLLQVPRLSGLGFLALPTLQNAYRYTVPGTWYLVLYLVPGTCTGTLYQVQRVKQCKLKRWRSSVNRPNDSAIKEFSLGLTMNCIVMKMSSGVWVQKIFRYFFMVMVM